MGEHTVAAFDNDLGQIDGLIRSMGELAGAMVGDAARALSAGDRGLAQRVVADDRLMDDRQRELDERAVTLIAKRQPMAQDLRAVVGAIRIAAELERVGDLAKNIAKRVGSAAMPRPLSHSLDAMAGQVIGLMRGIIEAFAASEPEVLSRLRAEDEQIDAEYTAVFRELLTYMMEDPRNITSCTHLLFCAKNLERIGDHATNIAENAFFVLTGQQLPIERPKVEATV